MKTNKMKKDNTTKMKRIAYWLCTGILAFGMLAGGAGQIAGAKWNAAGMAHLGYPSYVMGLLGTWKILGTLILLLPGYLLVKEWAYAGFFFVMTGAVVSHLASGDGVPGVLVQLVFVALIVLSWWLRPAERKLSTFKTYQHA